MTQNVVHASICHRTTGTFQEGTVPVHSPKEGSFRSKKGSVSFKNSLERTVM